MLCSGRLDDALFCRIAVDRGLLAEEQVAQALEIQRGLTRPQRIGKILVAAGYLTPHQVDAVLRLQGEARKRPPAFDTPRDGRPAPTRRPEAAPAAPGVPPREDDGRLFGQLVVAKRFASEGEVAECVELQRELAARGEYVKLGELLVRKGYIARRDIGRVLDAQGKSGEEGPVSSQSRRLKRRSRDEENESALAELKSLAASGDVAACLEQLERIQDDRERSRLGERIVRRAFLQHAATRAQREGLAVKTCDLCETASAIPEDGGPCARCGAPLAP